VTQSLTPHGRVHGASENKRYGSPQATDLTEHSRGKLIQAGEALPNLFMHKTKLKPIPVLQHHPLWPGSVK
jgi:hypothetical protein